MFKWHWKNWLVFYANKRDRFNFLKCVWALTFLIFFLWRVEGVKVMYRITKRKSNESLGVCNRIGMSFGPLNVLNKIAFTISAGFYTNTHSKCPSLLKFLSEMSSISLIRESTMKSYWQEQGQFRDGRTPAKTQFADTIGKVTFTLTTPFC